MFRFFTSLITFNIATCIISTHLINRPGLAGAVLQSPLLFVDQFINWLNHILVQISSEHCQSQTGRARELTFLENVHPTLCVLCHVSCALCHVSLFMCHVSSVTCDMSFKKKLFFKLKTKTTTTITKMDWVVELVVGGSVIKGAYPV